MQEQQHAVHCTTCNNWLCSKSLKQLVHIDLNYVMLGMELLKLLIVWTYVFFGKKQQDRHETAVRNYNMSSKFCSICLISTMPAWSSVSAYRVTMKATI